MRKLPLKNSAEHFRACHERWGAALNRRMESADYQDAWYQEQCGVCIYWVPLDGAFGEDWGCCTCPASEFDGRARFEHDGCEHHDAADEWNEPSTAEMREEDGSPRGSAPPTPEAEPRAAADVEVGRAEGAPSRRRS